MYRYKQPEKTSIIVDELPEGETLEMKIERIVNNKEPIKDGAPPIYTERKAGILPAYNVRTDRWEIALDGTEYITKSTMAKRDAKIVSMEPKKDGETESTQGTN